MQQQQQNQQQTLGVKHCVDCQVRNDLDGTTVETVFGGHERSINTLHRHGRWRWGKSGLSAASSRVSRLVVLFIFAGWIQLIAALLGWHVDVYKRPQKTIEFFLLKQSQSDTLFVARNPQKEKHLYDSSPSRKSAKTVVQLGQTVFGVGPRFRLGNRRVDDLYMYEKWLPLFNFRSSLCA